MARDAQRIRELLHATEVLDRVLCLHLPNSVLAEIMTQIVSVLNNDVNYCQAHFPLFSGKLTFVRKSIGERVRDARKAKGWSQQRLADAVKVSRAAVSQWESGETKELKAENVLAVAQVLNVRIPWLVNEEGPMRAEPPMTVDEMTMLEIFRGLSAEQQESLLKLLGGSGPDDGGGGRSLNSKDKSYHGGPLKLKF